MKTLTLPILIALFATGTYFDCTKTVEGYLQQFGTDHFPHTAVITEKYGRLFLDLAMDKQNKLWSEREAGIIRITGKIREDQWRGETHLFITPEKWEWIENPDD